MSTRERALAFVRFAAIATMCCASVHAGERYDLGRAATEAEIRAWDIDVRADGAGLPFGRGSVAEGGRIYAEKCAACHGDRGQGENQPGRPPGGIRTARNRHARV